MTFSNGPMFSSQNGWTQPPKRKSLVGSSSGPPGACITPSSDRKTAPVSLRIDRLAVRSRLDRRDVDLAHRHHRLEGALAPLAGFARQLEQPPGRDLPGKAPFVLAPAAHALFAAILSDRVPVAVGLFLTVGEDHEADGLVGLEVRAAIQTDERLAENGELDSQLIALASPGIIGHGAMRGPDVAVGEDRRIEFSGFAALAFVEPKAGGHLVGHFYAPTG